MLSSNTIVGSYESAITVTTHSNVAVFLVPAIVVYGIVAITLLVCGLNMITDPVGEEEVDIGMFNEGTSVNDCLAYLKELGHNSVEILKYQALNPTSFTEGLKAYASSLFLGVNSGQIWGLTASMCLAPVIMFIIAWVVLRKKYIIDRVIKKESDK